jgi:hypothetical protein
MLDLLKRQKDQTIHLFTSEAAKAELARRSGRPEHLQSVTRAGVRRPVGSGRGL